MAPSTLTGAGGVRELPVWWPEALHPDRLDEIAPSTPALVCDLDTVSERFQSWVRAMETVACHYAVKCNPAGEIVRRLWQLGSSFEVASAGEMDILLANGVPADAVLFSNTMKPASHIAAAYDAGLWRFAFDSETELHKIARYAPGSAVYVRLRVDDSAALFPLSRKFGAEAPAARALLLLARQLGLRPYGVTFHVGSQCGSPSAWRQAIAAAGRLMTQLAQDGIELEMLDIGGGFAAHYDEPVPRIHDYADVIHDALATLLPYRPALISAEPGRHMVAESAVLVASVLGREVRAGEEWLYIDVGAYHGLMETQQTMQGWAYPLWTSRHDHATARRVPFTVTGPTCDSNDTVFHATPLPETMDVDDRLYIGSAGAYTVTYACNFNGFPPPQQLFVGSR